MNSPEWLTFFSISNTWEYLRTLHQGSMTTPFDKVVEINNQAYDLGVTQHLLMKSSLYSSLWRKIQNYIGFISTVKKPST